MEFLQELQAQGMKVRELTHRPKLEDENIWLYDAYRLLSRSRQLGGMSEFYIPLTEYQAYFEITRLHDVEQRLYLMSVITQVDAVLLHERFEELSKKTAR
ncbi:hypothetical protein V9W64_10895 [Neisseria leonii]|uniref:Uncharacterized protein n=1 Tax=Neisseria leonii TaxID=2995413 RepID=A0A9X4E0W0_9NEIS|nr:hypothetical protein [Neisseria sp. 51.81]MDD9326749.1 hypothetical protein [Neisseria sp. 51.81]